MGKQSRRRRDNRAIEGSDGELFANFKPGEIGYSGDLIAPDTMITIPAAYNSTGKPITIKHGESLRFVIKNGKWILKE